MFHKIKAFIRGFDYSIKYYDKIQDYHFHSLPGAKWFDLKTQKTYRKGIYSGRKYMQYRLEVLTLIVLLLTTFLFVFTW
jgi:hypothetical protein